MNTIQIASTIAVVTGLAGLVPQIWAMTSTRSSSGQSPTGWSLGIGVNVLMGYVNFTAYGAMALALGNLLGTLLCSVALTAVLRYRRPAAEPAERPLMAAPEFGNPLSELPTGQFWTLKQELEHEESRRLEASREPELAAAA